MKYYELYAMRIKELCMIKSIKLNRLSTLSGIPQSTLNNIVKGTSQNPKIKTLHQIAVTFDMTVSEFLDFPELNEYPFDDENPLDE